MSSRKFPIRKIHRHNFCLRRCPASICWNNVVCLSTLLLCQMLKVVSKFIMIALSLLWWHLDLIHHVQCLINCVICLQRQQQLYCLFTQRSLPHFQVLFPSRIYYYSHSTTSIQFSSAYIAIKFDCKLFSEFSTRSVIFRKVTNLTQCSPHAEYTQTYLLQILQTKFKIEK